MSELLLSLLTFAVIATASPGGATTLATASGMRFGLTRSLPLLFGIALGLASLVGVVAGGLGSLVMSWPALQFWLRLFGSAYLLWLAWTIGRRGAPSAQGAAREQPIPFGGGFLLLWSNPKGWTMAVGAAGAYTALAQDPVRLGLLLAAVFGVAAILSLLLWCSGGQVLARLLKSENQWRAVNIALALLLVASILPMWR
ncbi:LysE family translocator [Dongia sedimenti]|uniref:LysE family translocator n=1 Tax=Dongia sedimenti TaxID=3064282 RepID=A0ABU0YTZ5_9PROT|nr:LysE family translocator [Rhodospirillaceae bacterium R-7]